ncbi:MAG: hypothetical protein V1756_00920 [Patescibacteria group bacterium]
MKDNKSMKKKILIILIVLIVLGIGGFFIYKFTDQSNLGLFTLISAIVLGIILGIIEIAERVKKLNNKFNF